jgi:hypothetical protein
VLPVGAISVAGHAGVDVAHLLAELIENAAWFSPPHTAVLVAGELVPSGYLIEIEDRDPGQVRPYAITSGRTRPASRLDLPLEALVRLTPRGQAALELLALEWREITLLSQRPVALAELSARLRIPLGVGRVLVTDM